MTDNAFSSAIISRLMGQAEPTSNPYNARRRFGWSAMQAGSSTAPVRSVGEGIARALQGAIGGYISGSADRDEIEAGEKEREAIATRLEQGGDPATAQAVRGMSPQTARAVGATLLGEQMKTQAAGRAADSFSAGVRPPPPGTQVAGPQAGGPQAAPQPQPQITTAPLPAPGADPAATAIAGIESAGLPNGGYGAIGPVANAQGNRAHGRYQVMDFNIGPWTKEVLGKEMTPQEFLATPQAQDAVFKAKFGEYRAKYGSDEAAARAWFAGEGGMNDPGRKDVNNTTVADYSKKFQAGMPQVAQGSDISGAQPPAQIAQAPVPPRADGSGTPLPPQPSGVPDVPRPAYSPELIKKYEDAIRSGAMNPAQARIEMDKENMQEWNYLRENRKLAWTQQREDERARTKGETELRQKAPMEMIAKRVDNYEKNVRPQGESAVQEVGSIHQVRQLLDAGAFTGTGADAQAFGSRVAQAFGLDWGADTQANTAALQSAVGNRVLALVKNLGTGSGISNADREYASKIAGGEISVGEPAMRRILEIGERAARAHIKSHDAEAARTRKLPGMDQLGDEQFKLQEAPTYEAWAKANPLQAPSVTVQATPPKQMVDETGQPPIVNSPEEAAKLPRGTQFRTPDGRLKVVP